MNIGNQIRALRLRRGVTQEEMAQHFGITAQAVSEKEWGDTTGESVDWIHREIARLKKLV